MIIIKRNARLPAVLIALSVLYLSTEFLAAGCGGKKAEGALKVAASIVPLADFCRNVGGGLVEVEIMVPPGASPHTFEPTSNQMIFLSDAGLFVYNGLDLETWVTEVVKKAGNRELVEVAAAESVPNSDLILAGAGHHQQEGSGRESEPGSDHEAEEERGESGDHQHGIYDPHVWLDPNLAVYEVEAIRDGLIKADPENQESYRKNAQEYIGELKELNKYVKGETSTFTRKKFVSFHPAFTYYAHRYGLEQVGVIEELPGKEPSAGEISKLIDVIKEQGVEVVFTEPQFNPKAAEAIQSESGAQVVLESLDPLGNFEDPEVSTYIKLIKHVTGVMAEAMK